MPIRIWNVRLAVEPAAMVTVCPRVAVSTAGRPPNHAQMSPANGGDAPPPVLQLPASQSGVPKLVEVSGFQNVLGMPPVSKPPSTMTWLQAGRSAERGASVACVVSGAADAATRSDADLRAPVRGRVLPTGRLLSNLRLLRTLRLDRLQHPPGGEHDDAGHCQPLYETLAHDDRLLHVLHPLIRVALKCKLRAGPPDAHHSSDSHTLPARWIPCARDSLLLVIA